jgi:hypothetical protein
MPGFRVRRRRAARRFDATRLSRRRCALPDDIAAVAIP